MATETIMPLVHPGEILLEEFLDPLGVSQSQLAKEILVRHPNIRAVTNEVLPEAIPVLGTT